MADFRALDCRSVVQRLLTARRFVDEACAEFGEVCTAQARGFLDWSRGGASNGCRDVRHRPDRVRAQLQLMVPRQQALYVDFLAACVVVLARYHVDVVATLRVHPIIMLHHQLLLRELLLSIDRNVLLAECVRSEEAALVRREVLRLGLWRLFNWSFLEQAVPA